MNREGTKNRRDACSTEEKNRIEEKITIFVKGWLVVAEWLLVQNWLKIIFLFSFDSVEQASRLFLFCLRGSL